MNDNIMWNAFALVAYQSIDTGIHCALCTQVWCLRVMLSAHSYCRRHQPIHVGRVISYDLQVQCKPMIIQVNLIFSISSFRRRAFSALHCVFISFYRFYNWIFYWQMLIAKLNLITKLECTLGKSKLSTCSSMKFCWNIFLVKMKIKK